MGCQVWEALGVIIAAGALLLSVIVWLTQRRQHRQQVELQDRLAAIEEARRQDEVIQRRRAEEAELGADVRVEAIRLIRGGPSGTSDRVGFTVANNGPASAENVFLAIKESADRAVSMHLGELIEVTDEVGGYSRSSPLGYYRIDAKPLVDLLPASTFEVECWLRYRLVSDVEVRISWVDGQGTQVRHSRVPFRIE
jgi:hypothetical protein